MEFRSYLSENGLHGTISFKYNIKENSVKITPVLKTTLEFPNQVWSWKIVEFPVDLTELENRCDSRKLGKVLVNLDDIYGYLILPENSTSEITTNDLKLTGKEGIFGGSLLLNNLDTNSKTCASLSIVDKLYEKTATATFRSPVAGNVYFRWFSKDNQKEMIITTDLYHVANVENHTKNIDFTEHKWKIYVTDIFDKKPGKARDDCNILQLVYDPENKGRGKARGDIDIRHGLVKISLDYQRNKYKTSFRDAILELLPGDLDGTQRRLYLVLFEKKHDDTFLACARIRYIHPISAK